MYNLIKSSVDYSKISMEYYRDEPALTDAGATDNFPGNSAFFKFKQKIRSATWMMIQKCLKKLHCNI